MSWGHKQRLLLLTKYFDLEGVALDCGCIFGLDRPKAEWQYHPYAVCFQENMFWLFITVCFVFFSTSTKALLDMNANDELTARVAKMVALLNLSSLPASQSCSKTKWKNITVWDLHLLQIILSTEGLQTKMPEKKAEWQWYGWDENMSSAQCLKVQGQSGKHCWRTWSRHCRPSRSTVETFKLNPFQPCATRIYLPKGTAKDQTCQRAWQKIIQSL